MNYRNAYIVLLLVLLSSITVSIEAAPVLITDVQYWLAPDHIQTIIFFNQAIQPSHHYRTDPDRFVLEFPNTEDIRGDETISVNDSILQRIRVQRLNNGTTQVVFDLTRRIESTVQSLPRFNGQPDRVIVTLFDSAPAPVPPQPAVSSALPPLPKPSAPNTPLQTSPQWIVVLDPGHGGKDSGAVGRSGLAEKDVVLDLAKKMKKFIQAQAPHITVYLTRDDDTFLPLRKRTEIAEDYQADLFISLHVNANPSRNVHGFSVYTLSENATDRAARALAEKENAADELIGGVATPVPQDDSLLRFVLADLSTTATLQHSLDFGRISLAKTIAGLRDYKISKEGLKRANFIVLRTAEMPAVLVEACYLSNKREEALLNQAEFRTRIAQALAQSTVEYFAQMQHSVQPQLVRLNDPAQAPTAARRVHVVSSGESLSVIAGRYKVNLAQLRQINHLASADLIYVGQRLWIP